MLNLSWFLIALVVVVAACTSGSGAVPVASGMRDLNGTHLFVETIGRGEPLLIVHGGPVLEHGYFLPHLEPLARTHRLIFFDQRLSGRSSADVDAADVRLDRFVEDIEALRQSEGLERFHLMAHSWGGLLAMKYAIAHGDRLKSLILLDSMPGSFDLWQQEQATMAARATPASRAERQAIVDSAAYARQEPAAYVDLYRLSFRGEFHRPELVERLSFYIAPDLEERSRRFGAIMQDLLGYDIHPDLERVDRPVLLVYGSDELPLEISAPELRKHLPHAQLVVIPDAGHFPFVEQPEAFFDAIRGFLEQHR